MPWEIVELADATHVIPLGGDELHDPSPLCWCEPRVELGPRPLIAHAAHGQHDRAEDRLVEPSS